MPSCHATEKAENFDDGPEGIGTGILIRSLKTNDE
jgi:hypothetical protein